METAIKEQKKATPGMRAIFWGARGSLPATIREERIKDKIFQVLTRARGIVWIPTRPYHRLLRHCLFRCGRLTAVIHPVLRSKGRKIISSVMPGPASGILEDL